LEEFPDLTAKQIEECTRTRASGGCRRKAQQELLEGFVRSRADVAEQRYVFGLLAQNRTTWILRKTLQVI
jgi:hypothetical protein